MLTEDELLVVEAMEADVDGNDDPFPAVPLAPDDDIYGDGGLGLRSLYDTETLPRSARS